MNILLQKFQFKIVMIFSHGERGGGAAEDAATYQDNSVKDIAARLGLEIEKMKISFPKLFYLDYNRSRI
jgi:hypothetical protein